MREVQRYICDVLIIGGSYAGLTAALQASLLGLDVVVMDKGNPGDSGCARFAAGDVQCFLKNEDCLEDWIREYKRIGKGLNSEEWLKENLPEVEKMIRQQICHGAAFLQDEHHSLVRKKGRGNLKSAVMNGEKTLHALYHACRSQGVRFLKRTLLTDLLEKEKRIFGAFGLDFRNDQWVVVTGQAVILASGGCGFRGNYFGMGMATGDGVAIAMRHGAKAHHMEFSNKYQSTHKDFDFYGMNRFVSHGGKFINGQGDSFMKRYQPVTGDSSNLTELTYGIYQELKEGRGPILFDLSGLSEENRTISNELLKPLMCLLRTVDKDFFQKPQEWIPCFTGSVGASSAGLKIGKHYETSLKGLYAVGDAASKGVMLGACIGLGGIGMMFALVSGNKAACYVKEDMEQGADFCEDTILKVIKQEEGRFSYGAGGQRLEAEQTMQNILFKMDCSFMKEQQRLTDAFACIFKLMEGAKQWQYTDAHNQMKCYETWNMLLNASAFLFASEKRCESRGGHLREDYKEEREEYQKIQTVFLDKQARWNSQWEVS